MANQLTMALIDTIDTLHQRGWSQRRIADELGIHRDTVARYLQQAKPAIAPLGSEPIETGAKSAIAPLGSESVEAGAKPAIAPLGSAEAELAADSPRPCLGDQAGPVTAPRGGRSSWGNSHSACPPSVSSRTW